MAKLRLLGVVGIVAGVGGIANVRAAQPPQVPLGQILRQAGAYVDAFQQELTVVIAEETYDQGGHERAHDMLTHRDMKSDLGLFCASDGRCEAYRDVFEVDGHAVREHQDRLTRLFSNASASNSEQLRTIVEESARYNLGDIGRTLNTPMFALNFLLPPNQRGSTFTASRDTSPQLMGKPPSGTVVVAFDEHKVNTLIRTNANKDLPSHGRFWVDPVSGRVVMSELVSEDSRLSGVIDVRYGRDASTDMWVPLEMEERYQLGGTTVSGHATYGHFRKFRASGTLVTDPRGV